MKKDIFTQRFTACLLAAIFLLSMSPGIYAAAAGQAGNTDATDPRLDMVKALEAMGPHPSLGNQAKIFGRLVGTWDVEYTDYSKDGKVSHRSGELIVGWVMDGRAIQDLWIVYPSGARKERELYADLRYFDPKSRTWPAIFVDPEHASVARFTGGPVGDDRIVLDTPDLGEMDTRWSFNDIRPDSFVFRDQASGDGGKTWRLQSEYQMKRRGVAAPAQSQSSSRSQSRWRFHMMLLQETPISQEMRERIRAQIARV
jgi:hypothetical protein